MQVPLRLSQELRTCPEIVSRIPFSKIEVRGFAQPQKRGENVPLSIVRPKAPYHVKIKQVSQHSSRFDTAVTYHLPLKEGSLCVWFVEVTQRLGLPVSAPMS